jgi:SSS family solute:Na+ symporter
MNHSMKTTRTCGILWLFFSASCGFAGDVAPVATDAGGIGVLDWIVIAGYFVGMLGIGWFYSRQTKNTEDFFLGGRGMGAWMVGLSLFATLLSTATYIAFPGEAIRHGPMVVIGTVLSIPPILWIVGWFVIPKFMKLPVTSANELLEIRLGLSIRLLGTAFFLVLRLLWMAMIIYITVKAVLVPVLGLDAAWMPLASLVLGTITVVYTSSGGYKAVVLTDVIQTFIMFLGAILSIGVITYALGGLVWFPTSWNPGWDPISLGFDPSARVSLGGSIMMCFLWYVCTSGSDQLAVQRYLSTRDVKTARRAFTISLLAGASVLVLLSLLGFALLAFYEANPQGLPPGTDIHAAADTLFSSFIVSRLPSGVTGLIVAALLSAAMSSLSSGLNSSCTIITVDLFDRLNPKHLDPAAHVLRARRISWVVGAIIILLSLGVDRVPGNLNEVVNKLGNLLVAPLFLLFFMALFVRRATVLGTWLGAAASVAVAVAISFFEVFGLSFTWILPGSLAAGVVVGVGASLVIPTSE